VGHSHFFPFHSIFAYSSLMGGERASTARMRLDGRICCVCKSPLRPPQPGTRPGERYCNRCEQQRKGRRVYVSFMLYAELWNCQFLEEDLKTSLPRKLNLSTSDKVIELIRRGGGIKDLADRQAVERAIGIGRGGAYLMLTGEQYQTLKQAKVNRL